MNDRLTGRVALVTGGAHGLGSAYAERLVAAGARVVIADIDAEATQAAVTRLAVRAGVDQVLGRTVDVCDEDQVERLVTEIGEHWDRVDALVNNAGGALLPTAAFDTFSRADWSRVIDLNLTAQWVCAARVATGMRAAGYGKVVNVSSTTVGRGTPFGLAPYTAAKSGVVGLTRALARELGPDGITVNAIAPGYIPVETPKTVHSADGRQTLQEQMIAEQCLPRAGTAQDLSGAVEFLCSADSDFITGQVLNVDGGWIHD